MAILRRERYNGDRAGDIAGPEYSPSPGGGGDLSLGPNPNLLVQEAEIGSGLSWQSLKDLSIGKMKVDLEALGGGVAKGFFANTVARLKQLWRAKYDT